MIDEIVDLVVAVNQCSSILRLRSRILEERYRVVVVWDFAYSDLCLYIDRLGLRSRNGTEGLDLSVVKGRGLAEAFHVDRAGSDTMQLRKRSDGIMPPVLCEKTYAKVQQPAHISVLSSAVTPGNAASSKIRPSRNSMM